MSDTWIQKAICESIDVIVNKRIAQTGFDTTIKAIIKQCSDPSIGEYKVKYQDSDLIVYASTPQVTFKEGQQVLIHVPSKNLSNRKTILGGVSTLATTYKDLPPASNLYNRIGTNAVTTTGNFAALSSYQENIIPIYNIEEENENCPIKINQQAIKNYIKRGNGLAFGCYIRTNFDSTQVGGTYGLELKIKFIDSNGEIAERPYHVGSIDVKGNPYNLIKPQFVECFINDINVDQFDSISSISVWTRGFPQDPSKSYIYDIWFSDLQIFGSESLSEQDLNGYSLHIDYSKTGEVIYSKIDENNNTKIFPVQVTAQLKVKGQLVTQGVQYYWFRQNGRVLRGSSYGKYSSHGGDGWECLNFYMENSIIPIPRTTPDFTFINPKAGQQQLQNGVAALSQKETKIKCVAVINGQDIASGQCIIKNSIVDIDVQLDSSEKTSDNQNKTIFYYDNGTPTLTCKIYQQQKDQENKPTGQYKQINKENYKNYSFYWTIVPFVGDAIDCNNEEQYYEYHYTEDQEKLIQEYNLIQNNLVLQAQEDQRKYLQTKNYLSLQDYQKNFKQGVEKLISLKCHIGVKENPFDKNVFYNFPINKVVKYSTLICTVYDNTQAR